MEKHMEHMRERLVSMNPVLVVVDVVFVVENDDDDDGGGDW